MATLGTSVADPAAANAPALQAALSNTANTGGIEPAGEAENDKKSSLNGGDHDHDGSEKDLRAQVDLDDEGEVQEGVRVMRAVTQVWSKQSLIAAYVL